MQTMMRKCSIFIGVLLLTIAPLLLSVSAQKKGEERALSFDRAEDEEDLNRELWEFAGKMPYAEARRYVAEAQRRSHATRNSEAVLPNGWKLAPAGRQTEVGRLPYEAVAFAGHLIVLNTGYYTKEAQEVSVVDTSSGQVVKTLRINSLFPSAQVGMDGDLYISGGFDQKVFRVDQQFNIAREYAVEGFAAGLAAVDAKHIAVADMVTKNTKGDYVQGKLALLNTETGVVERSVNVGHFPYAVRHIGGKLYVTLLGENRLMVYDELLSPVKQLGVGITPQEMCVDGERLYVVNSNSDDLSVIDTRRDAVVSKISVKTAGNRFGNSPTSCAVDGNRIYVTLAGPNAVAVLDKRTGRQLGLIPTGWYPTKVLVNDTQLLVLNAKGIRERRPNPNGPNPIKEKNGPQYVLTLLQGSVSVIPKAEINARRAAWTRQVIAGSPLFSARRGFKLPIRYVFYIIKENRTYDQVLGDLGRGNGDPALTLFGRDVSPNHHALAEQFVTLDNFYADGEISVLGHSFTTSGYASPFLEWVGNAAYSGRYKGYPFGSVPAVTSPSYLWDALDDARVDYRIYGENYFLFTRAYRILKETYGDTSALVQKYRAKAMNNAAIVDRGNTFFKMAWQYYGQANTVEDAAHLLDNQEFTRSLSTFLIGDESLAQLIHDNASLKRKFAEYLYHYAFNYRSWDIGYSDLDRVQAWRTDFENQLKTNRVVQFQYLWLPNDHTNGTDTSLLNPYQYVAQNDAALARIVETISHSPIWRNSLILIEEDDAQNGPDHVDATRTLAFAVGPYVKRDVVISDRYDQLSMLRTVELLLGLNSLNLNDRMAVPMFGIFTSKPNLAPYVPTEPSARLTAEDKQKYESLSSR